jgi:hypothetical protein
MTISHFESHGDQRGVAAQWRAGAAVSICAFGLKAAGALCGRQALSAYALLPLPVHSFGIAAVPASVAHWLGRLLLTVV